MILDEWCVEDEREWDARDPFCQCGSCAIFGLMLAEDEPEDARTCGYCKLKKVVDSIKDWTNKRLSEVKSSHQRGCDGGGCDDCGSESVLEELSVLLRGAM